MPSQNLLLYLPLFLLPIGAWLASRNRRSKNAKISAAEERSLWVGLAAGLFDADDCPPTSRLEIALDAISRKLGLRGALITRHGRNHCAVLAASSTDPALLRGLERGSVISRGSVYCGSLHSAGQCLAIDYASLSEWRGHSAFRERGWESYIAVNCGRSGGEDIVVAFFDFRPRGSIFTRTERVLVEQLAPWISAMVDDKSASTSETVISLPELLAQRGS
ncbi:MAG: hypothetical protein ACXVB9_15755 [Bdellovibrionota bacterium]